MHICVFGMCWCSGHVGREWEQKCLGSCYMHSPCGGHVHVEHGVCNERIEEICFNQFKDPGKGWVHHQVSEGWDRAPALGGKQD